MGAKLLKEIANATGLPGTLVEKNLIELVEAQGIDSKEVSLDELRKILAQHLREVLIEAKESIEEEADLLA